jgi:hypothetical protein
MADAEMALPTRGLAGRQEVRWLKLKVRPHMEGLEVVYLKPLRPTTHRAIWLLP